MAISGNFSLAAVAADVAWWWVHPDPCGSIVTLELVRGSLSQPPPRGPFRSGCGEVGHLSATREIPGGRLEVRHCLRCQRFSALLRIFGGVPVCVDPLSR
jgi:hypothetical protein